MQVNPDNKVHELRPTDEKNVTLPLPLPIPPVLIEARCGINAELITLMTERQIEWLIKGNVSLNQFHSYESKYPFISQLFNGQTEFETLTPVQTQLLVYYLLKSNPAKSLSNLFEWLDSDTHVSKFDAFNIFFEANNVSIKFENVSIKMSVSQFFRLQKGKDIEETVLIKTRDKTFTEKEGDRQYSNFAHNEYLTLVAGVRELIIDYHLTDDRKTEATRNYDDLLATCSFINWFGKISLRGCYALFDYKRDKNLNNLNAILGTDFKDINSVKIYCCISEAVRFPNKILEYLLWPLINNAECFPIFDKICQELKLISYSVNVTGKSYSLNHILAHSIIAKYNYKTFSSPYNLDLGRRISEYFPYFKITIYPIPVSNPVCVIFERRNVNQEILSGNFDLHDLRKNIIIKLNDNCQFDSNLPSLTYKFLKTLTVISSRFPPIKGCTYMSLEETLACMKARGIESEVFAYILGLVGKDDDALKVLGKLSAFVDFSKVPNYTKDEKTIDIAKEVATLLGNEYYVVLPEAAYKRSLALLSLSLFLKPGALLSPVCISKDGKNYNQEFVAGNNFVLDNKFQIKFADGLKVNAEILGSIYELVKSVAGYSNQSKLMEDHPYLDLKEIFKILNKRLLNNSRADSLLLSKIISNIKTGKESIQLLRNIAEVVDFSKVCDYGKTNIAKEVKQLLANDEYVNLPEPAYTKLLERLNKFNLFIRPEAKLGAVRISIDEKNVTQEVINGNIDLLDLSKNFTVKFEDGITLNNFAFHLIEFLRVLTSPDLKKNHPYVDLKTVFEILSGMTTVEGLSVASSLLLEVISNIKSGKDSIQLLSKIASVVDIKGVVGEVDIAKEAEQLLEPYRYISLPEPAYGQLYRLLVSKYIAPFLKRGSRLSRVCITVDGTNVNKTILEKINFNHLKEFNIQFEDGFKISSDSTYFDSFELVKSLAGYGIHNLKDNHPYIDLKGALKRLALPFSKNSNQSMLFVFLEWVIEGIRKKNESIEFLRKIFRLIDLSTCNNNIVNEAYLLLYEDLPEPTHGELSEKIEEISPPIVPQFVPLPQLTAFKSILARIEKDIYGDPEVHASAVKYLFKQRGHFKLDGEMGKVPPIYQKCIQDYFFCNGQGDLTENMSIQVAETLFWAKFAEMRVKAAEIMTPQKGEASSRPCYIITQDTNRVHVKVLLAHFNEYGFLKAFGYDAEGVSREMLAGITGIGQAHETQTISIGQFRRLVQAIETMDVPPIMIERKKLNFYEPQEEGAVKPAEEVEEAAPIQEEGSKRKAEKLDKPEPKKKKVELPPDSVHKIAELPSAASKVKLRKPTDKKVKGKYKDLEWAKKPAMQKKTPKEVEDGILPNLPQVPLNIDQPELELDAGNLWKFVGLNSARKLEKSLLDCDTLMSNLRQDIPLMDLHMHGPVLKLKQDKAAAVAPLNLLAKDYQIKEISQLLTAMGVGLNKLLSFEMGLGKTFVYVSLILEHIYRGTKGTHFITVPKSLIDSIYKDAVRILQEGVLTAWRYSFRKDPVKTMDEWFTRMFESDPKGLDRLPLLMALSDVENDVIRQAFEVRRQDYTHLVSDLIPQIEGRIKKMAADVANRPDKYEALEDAFLGTSLALSDILEGSLKDCLPRDPAEYLKVLSLVAIVNYARKPFPEEFSYDSKGIEALKRFKITSIGLVREFKEFRAAFNCPIILQTYDTVANPQMVEFKAALEKKGTATAIFDEAQNMHNEKTNCFKGCQAFLSWIKPLQILPVTGTPLENNLKEVYTLLSIANPELFPQHICNALVNLFGEALKWIKAKNKDKAHSLILRSFAHHEVVKELAFAPLTDVVNKENPLVKSEWDNMVPEKIDISIPYSFTPPLQTLYEKLFQDYKQGRAGLFDFNSNVNKLLTSSQIYSAASFTRDDPTCVQFLDKIRHGTAQEFQEVIESSPILTTLLKSEEMDAVVRGKEHALVFTANIVTAVALKRALEKRYGKDKVDVHFIKGKTKPEKRDRHITDFKRKDGKICRVFIVTSDTGSVGFNLGEADRVFMLDQDYNPMKQAQMEARVLRVGFSGTRRVVTPQINSGSQPIYSEVHKTSLQNLKKSLYGFLFNPKATYKENLKHWCDILLDTIYHQQLNADKSAAVADTERRSYLELIEQLDAFTEEELKDYVELLTPEVEETPKRKATPEVEPQPKRVAPPPTELKRKTPPEAVDLAAKKTLAPSDVLNPAMYLPIPSGTKAESLKLGMLIAEGYANAQVFTSVRALAPLIRNPKQELLHHFEQHHKILRDLAAPLQGASRYRIEYYTLQAGRYVLNNVENPAYGKKIRLVIDRPDDYSLLVKFS